MASLGDLVVNLVADSSRMAAGLREGQAMLNAFAAATAAMASASVYRFVAVGDAFNDMATRTGIAVESLSALSYAAKLSDTSAEGLQSSLFKMAKFLDGVRSGSSEAASTLHELSLSASQMLAASPEQQFAMFADAIKSIQDPSLRVAAAMKVFGKGAAEIIPLLLEGSSGIGAMVREAESLNVVMSGETAAAAAETANAIDRLTTAFDAASVKIGAAVAPAVKLLANALAFLVGINQDVIQTFAMLAIGVASAVAAMKAITIATDAYSKAQKIALALSGPKGWLILGGAVGALTFAAIGLNEQFAEVNKQLESIQQNAPAAAAAVAGVAPQKQVKMDWQVRAERVAAMQTEALGQQMATADAQAQKFRNSIAQLTDDYWTLWHMGENTFDQQTLEKYKQALIGTASGYTDAVNKLQDELAVLRGETTAQEQQFAQMAAYGVSDAQIEQLRAMQAERDKILKQQEAQRQNEQAIADAAEQSRRQQEAAQEAMKSEAAAIIDSLKTPMQKAQEQVNKIQQLQKQGLLTKQQADAAIAEVAKTEAERMRDSQKQTPQQVQFASAMQRGSSAAFNAILASMGRNVKDPNVQATETQTQQIVNALKQNKVSLEVAGPVG